jgi:LPXTG-motif cell wall-anchored protein
MKSFTRSLIVVCLFAICLFVLPTASADDTNNRTKVTFSAPFEVPGVGAQVLPAGTYVFKLLDSPSDRHIVQIFNEKQDHIFTTILAIPNYRMRATGKTVMTFKERAEGEPQAIRTWFYPGRRIGEEFVYPKEKALALAKIVNEPVFFTPVVATTVEELQTIPILALKPTGEEIPVAQVVQPEPVETATMKEPATLPKTGSNLPLLACIGLLSLGAAGFARKFAA